MSTKTLRILLVDDDEGHVGLIRRVLMPKDKKFNLTIAGTLADARKILKERPPDLMIADYLLPDGKGIELLPGDPDKLTFPIAILTSHGNEMIAAAAMKAGAIDYIVKSSETFADMPHIIGRMLREWRHITKRKQAENTLRKSDKINRSLLDGLPIRNEVIGLDSKLQFMSAAGIKQLKIPDIKPYYGQDYPPEFFNESTRATLTNHLKAAMAGRPSNMDLLVQDMEGNEIWYDTTFVPAMEGGHVKYIFGSSVDITRRKKAEIALRFKQDQLKSLLDVNQKVNTLLEKSDITKALLDSARFLMNSTSGMVGLVEDGHMIFSEFCNGDQCNPADYTFEPGYGVPGHIMQTLKPYISNDVEHDVHTIPDIIRELDVHQLIDVPILNRSGQLLGCFEIHNRKDGRPFDDADIELLEGLAASAAVALENARLFSERKQAEEALREEKKRACQIIETARDAFVSMDADGIIIDWNPQAEEMFGWSSDEALGQKLAETLIPESFREAHNEGLKHYLATGEGHILHQHIEITAKHRDGHTLPVELSIVPMHTDNTITFNAFIRDTSARKKAQKALKLSLVGTILAISKAVEARDPYTAGHQQRVARLARSIAQEMGLGSGRIDGLRMGATIHDIGKIHLPAEILSKPTKLTEIEFEFIKTHAQVGYDILKDIEFPWPIADIAYQHHERLDGTGYPRGLKGEEICLEARIVAVADVVEAISSHRPYRASLGMDVALEEIKTHRGKWFEPAAVDACLKLIREKKFSFDDKRLH